MAINEVPPEILSKIFLAGKQPELLFDNDAEEYMPTVPSMASSGEAGFSSEAYFQYRRQEASKDEDDVTYGKVLSLTCRHWRQVANATPSLWTMIQFTLCRNLRWIPIWLNRSGQVPLDIIIVEDRDSNVPDDLKMDSLNFVMHLFISNVHRWRTFVLDVAHQELMQHTLHEFLYLADGAPLLRYLSLSYHISPPEDEFLFDKESISGFGPLFSGHTSVLSHLNLSGVHINWETDPILRRLKSLRLAHHEVDGELPWKNFVQMFIRSPQLHSFEINNSGPTHDGTRWSRNITNVRRLKRLSFANMDPQYCGFLLERFHLPVLKELTLDFDDGNQGQFIRDRLIDGNSGNMLQRLEIIKLVKLDCPRDVVSLLYHNLQSLIQLHLNLGYLSRDFLLQMVAGPPIALPRLQTLIVEGVSGRVRHVQIIVKERRLKGFPLRRLLISSDDEMEDEDVEWFKGEVRIFGRC